MNPTSYLLADDEPEYRSVEVPSYQSQPVYKSNQEIATKNARKPRNANMIEQ
jgi:hypothetical protein